MLAILSPAKTLEMEGSMHCEPATEPQFMDQAQSLVKILKDYSPKELGGLMKLSEKLSELNAQRFKNWSPHSNDSNARQAIFAFQGDVYQGFDAASLDKKTLKYANKHLRILSGLYGLLKPLDWLQPYRLEMGTALKNPKGKDLYAFWGEQIAEALNVSLKNTKSSCLVNLASQEYFKSVAVDRLSVPIIEPVFKDEKNGQFKIISFYAKRARGMMARHMMTQKAQTLDDLKAFDLAGYQFDKKQSNETTLVFKRTEKAALKFKAA